MKKAILFLVSLMLMVSVEAQQQFTNFASKNTITSVADKGTQIWIGTSGGLYVRSKSTGAIILTYTIDNGLPSSYVNDIVVDPFDNVWVATRKGLAKFDGSSWTIYDQSSGLPNKEISGITVDQSGNIWVFSFWGTLSKLESDDTWTNYGASEGFPSLTSKAIQAGTNGNIWIATYGGGVYDFNISAGTFTQYIGHFGTNDRVYDLIIDASSNLWLASSGGLTKHDGSTWILYTTADGLSQDASRALTSDGSGNIWIGHYSSGITKFDPTGINTETFNENDGLVNNTLHAVTIDSDGKLWAGTEYGLSRYDVAGNSWNNYIVNNSLSNNNISDLRVDGLGNVWIGSAYGLSRLSGSTWTNWFVSDGLIQEHMNGISVNPDNDIWIGCPWGLSFLDVSTDIITKYLSSSNDFGVLNSIYSNSDGTVWLASSTGITHFNGSTITHLSTADGLIANNCRVITKDGSGNIWVGTSDGVSMWNGTSFTNYTTADGLSQNYISELSIASNGDIWAMTQGAVAVFNGTTWSTIGFNTTYDMEQTTNGDYWLANYWGIKKHDGTNTATYTSDDGLADDVIYEIAIAPNGDKWFGTGAGITKAVCENPIPAFTSNIACLPGISNLTNTSSQVDVTTTYEWDINNDGSVEYTTADATHVFTNEGTISVKLTVTNDDCTEVIIQDVTTYNTPIVSLNPSSDFSICSGSSALIEAQGSGTPIPIVTEDFNHANLAASGWTTQGDATTNWSIENTNNAGGTAPELRMNWNPSFNGESYIISQTIDVSSYGALNLSFSHFIDHYQASFTVSVKTSSNGTDWNTVWTQLVDANIDIVTESVTINNADIASSNFQVAFVYTGNSIDIDYWYIDDVVLSGAAAGGPINPDYTLAWSTGSSANSITVSTADTYSLTVTNTSCTYEPTAITVDVLEPIEVPICMVTVDTMLDKNLIVWEKPVTGAIHSFNIYREITTDNYQIIGSKLYSELSEFNDPSSAPNVHADKYKISVIDTCGNESDLSPFHQTMNLSQAQGSLVDDVVLLWNIYIDESGDFVPASYKVYRGLDPYSMTMEYALTGGLSTYNYNALSVLDNEHFMVLVDMPTCTPTTGGKASGGPYYQSTSNLEDEGIINTSINKSKDFSFIVFPNPVTDKVIIKSDKFIKNVNVYNISGELVRKYTDINSIEFEFLREDIASGTYFIEVNNQTRDKVIFE